MASERSGQEEYAFWAALVDLLKPKRILEIGTSAGFGTLALARNAPAGAEIVTIDIEDLRCEAIKQKPIRNIRIRFIQEKSQSVLNDFKTKGERFDLIVVDGGHLYDTVKDDWNYANQLTDIVLFHDALQFNGVRKVIDKIRRRNDWDVSVLSYPGTTLFDELIGEKYFSNRCPGIAIATRRRSFSPRSYKAYLEYPTTNSRRAFQRRKTRFQYWHAGAGRANDLSFADWEMIFHTLWNLRPDAVVHLGHVGTGATLLFMEFAKTGKAHFLGLDPTGKFWPAKKKNLPSELAEAKAVAIFTGKKSLPEAFSFVQNHQRVLLWVDEFYDGTLYGKPLQRLLTELPKGSLACIRNFSPHSGRPRRVAIGQSECTNPRADRFCDWLMDQTFAMRSAAPEATFGDYVNAGHWLMISL